MEQDDRPVPDTGLASLATVAAEAGVSVSTVSRIVNGETRRASPETVARVRAAIESIGYRPNHVGRALRRRESHLVAMLAANLDNPIMATIAAATEAALRRAGYVMVLCDTHDRPDLQDQYLDAMRAQIVKGYIVVGGVPSPGLKRFVAQKAPLVFVARRNPHGTGAFVGIDDRQAGADVAARFLEQGIDDLGVVFPAQASSRGSRERVEGFLTHLAANGVPDARVRRATGASLSHIEIGYDASQVLFAQGPPPRGVLCVSDQIAYGVYRRARENGIAVPETCRLVSIDGSALNRWITPWLASVEIPYADYGAAILDGLQAIWAGAAGGERILPHAMRETSPDRL